MSVHAAELGRGVCDLGETNLEDAGDVVEFDKPNVRRLTNQDGYTHGQSSDLKRKYEVEGLTFDVHACKHCGANPELCQHGC